MIIATHGILASAGGIAYDADAQAFFDRVTTAGGSLSETEKTAINTLVLDLKNYSIWSKIKAVYPMVGASAAACAQNLKSSSFTGTFNGGWTYSSTGVTSNGTNAFFDTNLNASTQLTGSNCYMAVYETNRSNGVHGIYYGPNFFMYFNSSTNLWAYIVNSEKNITTSIRDGFHLMKSLSSTAKVFTNGSELDTWTVGGGSFPNFNVYFGAGNTFNAGNIFTSSKISIASLGEGLTDTESGNFYTAVQTFNTTLSRQI